MKNITPEIRLTDYTYDLPEERIAKEPLQNRSDSKLLVYNYGEIIHSNFNQLDSFLSEDYHLVFNDTRVIPARIHFTKDTGALIEVFLLEPISPSNDVASAMLVKNKCTWQCMIGNLKKWKDEQILTKRISEDLTITAKVIDRENQQVEFSWEGNLEFVHVVEAAGKIPLPPYIDREVTYEDEERYQTIYSKHKGAVAAPTAGLHFDDLVMDKLKAKNINHDFVTLHVSAGTFQPIKVENAIEHKMHSEQIAINKATIENLITKDKIVAVGTTSMRTLESLFWYGIKLIKGDQEFFIEKLFPYQEDYQYSRKESLEAILHHMNENNMDIITGSTEIFIFPGYTFRMCDGLITNYHLPGSTLVLLVAAFIGEDWREVYKKAIANDYRFLSYGDSSLLLP